MIKNSKYEKIINKNVSEFFVCCILSLVVYIGWNINLFQATKVVYWYDLLGKKNILLFAIAIYFLFKMITYIRDTSKNISFIFWIILLGSIGIVFFEFIVGKGYYIFKDIGSDTFFQYHPYYINEVLKLKSGTFSVWNWEYGLGTNILNSLAWILDPFSILVVIIGALSSVKYVKYLMVWMEILKIIVSFIFAKKYLKYRLKNEFTINLVAYLIAFNGYLLLWGQHYFLGTAAVYTIMLFWVVEKYLDKRTVKSTIYLALMVSCILIYSYYTGYMLLLIAAIYYIFRYFEINKEINIKKSVTEISITVGCVLTGFLISSFSFITSSYYLMTTSTRLSGNTSNVFERIINAFESGFDIKNIEIYLSRMMTNNAFGVVDNTYMHNSNYYEMPQLVCTAFIFIILGQWIVLQIHEMRSTKRYILYIVKLILLYLLFLNPVTGLVTNAFVTVAYRYTFVVFPILGIIIGYTIQEVYIKKSISKIGVICGTVVSILVLFYINTHHTEEVDNWIIVLNVFVILGVMINLLMSNVINDYLTNVFFTMIIIVVVLENRCTSINRSYMNDTNYFYKWNDNGLEEETRSALQYIRDNDKSFYRIEKCYEEWSRYSETFFEQYSSVSFYNSTTVSSINDFYINIYNSAYSIALKHLELNSELDYQAINLVNVKYILSLTEQNVDNWILIKEFGNVKIYMNQNTDSIAKWYTKGIRKNEFEKLDDVEKARILKDTVVVNDSFTYPESEVQIEDFCLVNQTLLRGKVNCNGEGVLMIAIPYQEGWNIYIDGEKVSTFDTDYGFIGIELTEGSHIIDCKYEIPKMKLSIIMSLIGVILLLFQCVIISVSSKKALNVDFINN